MKNYHGHLGSGLFPPSSSVHIFQGSTRLVLLLLVVLAHQQVLIWLLQKYSGKTEGKSKNHLERAQRSLTDLNHPDCTSCPSRWTLSPILLGDKRVEALHQSWQLAQILGATSTQGQPESYQLMGNNSHFFYFLFFFYSFLFNYKPSRGFPSEAGSLQITRR